MEEINLKTILEDIWNKKIILLGIILLFGILGAIYTKTIVPKYKSVATLVLVKSSEESKEQTITQTEVTLNQKLVATYTELIKTNTVLREVIQNLGYSISEETLRNNVSVKLVTSTQLIEIAVTNEKPEIAQALTNEIVQVFMRKANEMYKLNNINIVDEAKLPTLPYNINHMKDIIVFIAIGIIVSMAYIFITNMLDSTIKGQEEVEQKLGLTVLAQIPQYDYEMKKKGKK